LSETKPHENPLVNNKKLRQMYQAMVEARVLEEHVAKSQRGVKASQRLGSTHGQEACRVSTAIELGLGDLISDSQAGGMVRDLVMGADMRSVLKRVAALGSVKTADIHSASRQLPWIEDVEDRLRMALGAALAFRTLKQTSIVVAYVNRHDANGKAWRRVLTLAAKLELPLIFVVLPESGSGKKDRVEHISAKARSCGLPGIPVDAYDAVALYRVAQESTGRLRGGGGPVVIECVAYRQRGESIDPISQMKDFMLGRKVCTSAWFDRADKTTQMRMQ
jgi:TPP-dependent pyruvate/acetoin dehydrogenase alpha subunit